jgi:SsrA-binding protein
MASKKKPKSTEPVILNRKARHQYHILETLETGIMLHGSEVKSVREGKASIGEGYVRADAAPARLTIHGMHIGEYQPAGANQHHPTRVRRLLAHKREILKLAQKSQEKGTTIVPLRIYFKNGYAKLEIGLAVGKTKGDKREDLKKREHQRDIDRAMTRKRL